MSDVSLCAGQCGNSEFWNSDGDVCVPCATCKQYPKTPSCNTCKTANHTLEMPWLSHMVVSVLQSKSFSYYQQVNLRTSHLMCGNLQPSPASQCWLSCWLVQRWLSGSWCIDASQTKGLYVVRSVTFEMNRGFSDMYRGIRCFFSINDKERVFDVSKLRL